MNKDNVLGKTKMIKGAVQYYWGKFTDLEWTKIQGVLNVMKGYSRDKIGNTKATLQRIKLIQAARNKRSQS